MRFDLSVGRSPVRWASRGSTSAPSQPRDTRQPRDNPGPGTRAGHVVGIPDPARDIDHPIDYLWLTCDHRSMVVSWSVHGG